MRKIPYRSHSCDIPISVSLFTTAFFLPHIPHSRPGRQFRIFDCHRRDFQLHCLFCPNCSISSCCERSFPEPPILHRKIPRCPSSSNEPTIGNLFPIRANGSIYKRNKLGSRLIIALTSDWLKLSCALEWFHNHPWNAFHWWYAR